RVWQRSVPLGGSHFTKALTKELKLTFAKAEHLKRNAQTAQDPKAVFQAMRPVFNDLLTEIQRSIAYFTSIDRAAKIERVLGNAIKLPGLRRYLAQSLGYEVQRLEKFSSLVGSEVLSAPAFVENQLCFGVCYGLVVQGLKKGPLKTNLLPREIVKDRLVRAKKPWAVGAAATLLLGCTISLASHAAAKKTVDERVFGEAEKVAVAVKSEADGYKKDADEALNQWKATDQIGTNVVQNIEGRVRWLELLRALSEALPSDPAGRRPQPKSKSPEDVSEAISRRNELHIRSLDCTQVNRDFVKTWLQSVYNQGWVQLTPEEIAATGITPTTPAGGATAGGASDASGT
ncbi:MAG: pilus assembly protein PilM, partial [Thermoguttaceae bacterium]|nr:pilus assembly protein PilM [Thermoguttaceae bacterium]